MMSSAVQGSPLEGYEDSIADRANRMADLARLSSDALPLLGVRRIVTEGRRSLRDLVGAYTGQRSILTRDSLETAIRKTQTATLALIENSDPILKKSLTKAPLSTVDTVEVFLATIDDLHLRAPLQSCADFIAECEKVKKAIGKVGCIALVDARYSTTCNAENWLGAVDRLIDYAPPATWQILLSFSDQIKSASPTIIGLQASLRELLRADQIPPTAGATQRAAP